MISSTSERFFQERPIRCFFRYLIDTLKLGSSIETPSDRAYKRGKGKRDIKITRGKPVKLRVARAENFCFKDSIFTYKPLLAIPPPALV